jgi:hypothetical protein
MSCPLNLLLSLLAILSIGITTCALITAYVWFQANHVGDLPTGLNLDLICGIVTSSLLLIFSLYASLCGKSCARRGLGVCFLIYTIGLIGVAFVFSVGPKMLKWVINKAQPFL